MTRQESYGTRAGGSKQLLLPLPLSRMYTSQTGPREAAGAVTIRKKIVFD